MMKLLPSYLTGVVMLATMSIAMAVEPPTNTPAAAKPLTGKTDAKTPPATAKAAANTPAPAPTSVPAAPATKLDDYFVELVAKVNLTDAEKKEVQDLYTADGTALQAILNNDSLSPLQQEQQVSDLRDKRNEQIERILRDVDRQKGFLEVEAVYRVSLTEFAADGGLIPPPPPGAPAPAPAPAAPATPAAPAASTNAAPATPAAPAPAK